MVGFRYFVVDRANSLALTGWVRNGDDGGSVELVAEGSEERLRQLEDAIRAGPRHAQVDGVDVSWSDEIEGFDGFEVRY